MIVRIQGEGQYELDDDEKVHLEDLDGKLFHAINTEDPESFASCLQRVVDYIEQNGTPIPNDRLVASDVILPASDTSLEEAKALLTDEGYLEPVEA